MLCFRATVETEAYKASREDADCNILVCPQILAEYIKEGRIIAWFVILTHTLIVESNYRDVMEFALHSVPSKCFKSITIKHVTATRASSETYFNRNTWMELDVPLYKQFALPPREEKGGPTYLSCVWKKCDDFANEDVVMHDDKKASIHA